MSASTITAYVNELKHGVSETSNHLTEGSISDSGTIASMELAASALGFTLGADDISRVTIG